MADKIRTLRVVDNNGSLALVIRERRGTQAPKVDAYFLTSKPGGVEFSKHDGTKHEVTPEACDCKGHKFYGSRVVCRHRAALARLIALGKVRIQEVAK